MAILNIKTKVMLLQCTANYDLFFYCFNFDIATLGQRLEDLREREKKRQTDRKTDRHKDRRMERQKRKDRQTERQTDIG